MCESEGEGGREGGKREGGRTEGRKRGGRKEGRERGGRERGGRKGGREEGRKEGRKEGREEGREREGGRNTKRKMNFIPLLHSEFPELNVNFQALESAFQPEQTIHHEKLYAEE